MRCLQVCQQLLSLGTVYGISCIYYESTREKDVKRSLIHFTMCFPAGCLHVDSDRLRMLQPPCPAVVLVAPHSIACCRYYLCCQLMPACPCSACIDLMEAFWPQGCPQLQATLELRGLNQCMQSASHPSSNSTFLPTRCSRHPALAAKEMGRSSVYQGGLATVGDPGS
jgi:hypothetical protein